MTQKKIKNLCPFCSGSFNENELIVVMKASYLFDDNNNLTMQNKAYDQIICSKCLNDITMSYIELLYEKNDYEAGFKDGYNDAVNDAKNNGDFTKL